MPVRWVTCVVLMLAPPFSWAQDGFERISTDTIEWNGHRFELLRVCELKEPMGHGAKKLINRKGEVVAIFNPCRPWEPNTSWYPSHLTIGGDTIVTLGNQHAQLAKDDSTLIMYSGGRGSPPVQVYNPITGLKTINSGHRVIGVHGLNLQYNFDQIDGIYAFGKVYMSSGVSGDPPCLARKYSFQGDMLWELDLDGEGCPGGSWEQGFHRERMNLMLSGSTREIDMVNSYPTFYLIDAEKGELKCSWGNSEANPGRGEFKSFVGNDKFVCLLGKEWVVYSLKGKCREIKRGKLLSDRSGAGSVGSFKSGRIIGWAHNITSEIQFIDLKSNRTEKVSIDGMVFGQGSRYIDENTILYKSFSSDKPDLIIRLIE